MSITFNEDALRRLLESADGPVGEHLQEKTEQVLDAVIEEARGVFHRFDPARFIEARTQENPLMSVVGVFGVFPGRVAFKGRETDGWLIRGLRNVQNTGG